jgi:hypothetical protein
MALMGCTRLSCPDPDAQHGNWVVFETPLVIVISLVMGAEGFENLQILLQLLSSDFTV